MKMTPDDAQYAIIDLHMFFVENPQYKLPPRFVWLLSNMTQMQVDRLTKGMRNKD